MRRSCSHLKRCIRCIGVPVLLAAWSMPAVADAPATAQAVLRFSGHGYVLAFRPDGSVELLAQQAGREVLLATVDGMALPPENLRLGVGLSQGSAGPGSSRHPSVEVGLVPLSGDDKAHLVDRSTGEDGTAHGWRQVVVNQPGGSGSLRTTWTLLPTMVHVRLQLTVSGGQTPVERRFALGLRLADGASPAEQIKPARWCRHPDGGVAFQRTAGMADRYTIGNASLVIAHDQGLARLYDKNQGTLHLRALRAEMSPRAEASLRPPSPSAASQPVAYEANLALAVGTAPDAMPLAVAAARGDGVMLHVASPVPFHLWTDPNEEMTLTVHVANLLPRPNEVRLHYVARDFDGQIIARAERACWLRVLDTLEWPLRLRTSRVGPIYLEVVAHAGTQEVFRELCLGVLPKRPFTDGHNSRFGISAYRGGVGAHTELRTDEQLLALMRWAGVRWLRACDDHRRARERGFFTWYQNGVSGPVFRDYIDGKPTWLNNAASLENYLTENLKRTLAQGDEVLEFTNEWNLIGGEGNGVMAERYARDWLIPIKRLRDRLTPGIRLAGGITANGDLVFLDKMHKAGGWDQFEILAFHAMGDPMTPDFDDGKTYWSYLASLCNIHEAMRRYGRKELWMTEIYAPTAPNSSRSNNERVAAEHIALTCALAIAADVRGFMFYCLDDFDADEEIKTARDIGEQAERESYFGLVRRDWCPKPGLWAYQTAAYLLDGATFLGDVPMADPNCFGLLFEGHLGRVALLWSRTEGYLTYRPLPHRPPWQAHWAVRTPVTVPAKGSNITVVDCVGHQRHVSPDAAGNAVIDLTGAPIYVLGSGFDACKGKYASLFRNQP